MTPLTSIELLHIWERGMDQSLTEKTLILLGKACSSADQHEIGMLSIGERDARLLQLREWLFGSTLRNIAHCPKCNDTVEWETNTRELFLKPISPDLSVKTFLLEKDGLSIRFRLPNTHDISKASTDLSYQADHTKLLSDCILEMNSGGKYNSVNDLPGSAWEALSEMMENEDPQADIRMNIECPACTHQWQSPFDIVSFLWAEIHNWAIGILQEVYLLGRSFGWSEEAILKMSSRRRQLYLQMIGA